MTRKITVWILLAIGVILIAWDVYVWLEPTEGDTISEVVHGWGTRSWFLLVGIGVLLGHFFWPLHVSKEP